MPTGMHVVFPDEIAEEIRTLIPEEKRTEFVVEATRERLLRERQRRALEVAAGGWASSGQPSAAEDVRSELEALRKQDQEREVRLESVRDGR